MKKKEIYERVANLVSEPPCLYAINKVVLKDKWCEEHCQMKDESSAECWEHAIKKEWF